MREHTFSMQIIIQF